MICKNRNNLAGLFATATLAININCAASHKNVSPQENTTRDLSQKETTEISTVVKSTAVKSPRLEQCQQSAREQTRLMFEKMRDGDLAGSMLMAHPATWQQLGLQKKHMVQIIQSKMTELQPILEHTTLDTIDVVQVLRIDDAYQASILVKNTITIPDSAHIMKAEEYSFGFSKDCKQWLFYKMRTDRQTATKIIRYLSPELKYEMPVENMIKLEAERLADETSPIKDELYDEDEISPTAEPFEEQE